MSSNFRYRCGQCGAEFTASYMPVKNPRCVICRQDPGLKKFKANKIRRKRSYVPIGLKVKIRGR